MSRTFKPARTRLVAVLESVEGRAAVCAAIEERALADVEPLTGRATLPAQECFHLINALASTRAPEALAFLQTLVPPRVSDSCYATAIQDLLMFAPAERLETEWLRGVAALPPDRCPHALEAQAILARR